MGFPADYNRYVPYDACEFTQRHEWCKKGLIHYKHIIVAKGQLETFPRLPEIVTVDQRQKVL